jgi:hypothetical protein
MRVTGLCSIWVRHCDGITLAPARPPGLFLCRSSLDAKNIGQKFLDIQFGHGSY